MDRREVLKMVGGLAAGALLPLSVQAADEYDVVDEIKLNNFSPVEQIKLNHVLQLFRKLKGKDEATKAKEIKNYRERTRPLIDGFFKFDVPKTFPYDDLPSVSDLFEIEPLRYNAGEEVQWRVTLRGDPGFGEISPQVAPFITSEVNAEITSDILFGVLMMPTREKHEYSFSSFEGDTVRERSASIHAKISQIAEAYPDLEWVVVGDKFYSMLFCFYDNFFDGYLEINGKKIKCYKDHDSPYGALASNEMLFGSKKVAKWKPYTIFEPVYRNVIFNGTEREQINFKGSHTIEISPTFNFFKFKLLDLFE